jgi:hypothetical protein
MPGARCIHEGRARKSAGCGITRLNKSPCPVRGLRYRACVYKPLRYDGISKKKMADKPNSMAASIDSTTN